MSFLPSEFLKSCSFPMVRLQFTSTLRCFSSRPSSHFRLCALSVSRALSSSILHKQTIIISLESRFSSFSFHFFSLSTFLFRFFSLMSLEKKQETYNTKQNNHSNSTSVFSETVIKTSEFFKWEQLGKSLKSDTLSKTFSCFL